MKSTSIVVAFIVVLQKKWHMRSCATLKGSSKDVGKAVMGTFTFCILHVVQQTPSHWQHVTLYWHFYPEEQKAQEA